LEIQIPIDKLRENKLMIATPMFGGQCLGMFCKSCADLAALCASYGLPMQYYFLFNESLITRARNYCMDEFMRSPAEHLMFIDADIGFSPQDVIALMALQAQDEKYDIIGGPYPKKCISWEKIKLAVDKGMADEDPNVLEKFVGDFVFNPKHGQQQIPIGEPVEVLEIGTGFMMISKRAAKKFAESFPQYLYRPDHARTEHFDGSREIMMYFQAEVDPKSKRYLSEDYWFCQKAQEIGLKTWLCPWMKTQHVGSYIFGGSLADLASIGASATVNPAELKKNRDKNKPLMIEDKTKTPENTPIATSE
jgi:glycosyltransferase involved in cell wall biosynthesis